MSSKKYPGFQTVKNNPGFQTVKNNPCFLLEKIKKLGPRDPAPRHPENQKVGPLHKSNFIALIFGSPLETQNFSTSEIKVLRGITILKMNL